MTEPHIHSSEKKVISIAILVSACHLLIIAGAAWFYGLTVPDCLEGIKPFTEGSLEQKTDRQYELHMVARMWAFDPPEIILPVGAKVDIFLSSMDVTHGFQIVGTNLNLMAVPGAVNYGRVTFRKPGDYPIVCNEYCGVAHHGMFGMVHVKEDILHGSLPGKELQGGQSVPAPNEPPMVAQGRKLYQEKGCAACHSLTGVRVVGPSFQGLFGSQVTFTDGSTELADEAYLKAFIRSPQKKIIKGFENVLMPTLPVTEEEISQLVEFIKTVK
jgi:cytochrome c oxidase subunit 2